MASAQPYDLSHRRVNELLFKARSIRTVSDRISFFGGEFLGRRYRPDPLIGSISEAEVFTASLDGFDCVTYIETTLALARSFTVDQFADNLRQIRYDGGRVAWKRRNHYMTSWIRNNIRAGLIARVPMSAVPTVIRDRTLGVLRGIAARPVRIRCIPKSFIGRIEPFLRAGDIICFVSTRSNLDVFHAGLIERGEAEMALRHASRSRGVVVEERLGDFLRSNRMSGVMVVRPKEIDVRPVGVHNRAAAAI
jgi:hypothetical protein